MMCFIPRVDSRLRVRANHRFFSNSYKTIMPGKSELAGILSTILRIYHADWNRVCMSSSF